MRAAARAAGRNPDEIEISTLAFALVGEDPVTPELLDGFRAMEAAGVGRIAIPRLLDADRAHAIHSLRRLGDELLQRYSAAQPESTTRCSSPIHMGERSRSMNRPSSSSNSRAACCPAGVETAATMSSRLSHQSSAWPS